MSETLPRRRLSGVKLATGQSGSQRSLPGGPEGEDTLPAEASGKVDVVDSPHLHPTSPAIQSLSWRIGAAVLVCFTVVIMVNMSFKGFSTTSLRGGAGRHTEHHRILAEHGIESYELVPDMLTENHHVRRLLESTGHKSLTLKLKVMEDEFELELERSDGLFSHDYHHKRIYADGRFEQDEGIKRGNNCAYRATIKNDPDSSGSVSLCGGTMQAIMFHSKSPKKAFTVTPLADDVHVVYRHLSADPARAQQVSKASATRSSRHCPEEDAVMPQAFDDGNRRRAADAFPVGTHNKTVFLTIVNDHARYTRLKDATEADTISIVNAVNTYYASLYSSTMYGVQFVLRSQLSFVNEDPWQTPAHDAKQIKSQELLNAFFEWKKTAELKDSNLVHMFSGRMFADGFVGRAAQAGFTDGGVCTTKNIGVEQMNGLDLGLYAKIAAHELGHSLSMPHANTYTNTECLSSTNTVMWPGISLDEGTRFSSCSIDTLKDFFEGRTPFKYAGCLDYLDGIEEIEIADVSSSDSNSLAATATFAQGP